MTFGVLSVLKINSDLLSTAVNSGWRVVSGPLMLAFIPLYLTSVQQGYWYTFSSLAALVVFADMGFSTIVLQFAAHSFSGLSFDENKNIHGDKIQLWKLSSFFRFSTRWMLKVGLIVFPIIMIGGYFFLNTKQEDVDWKMPWLIFSLSSFVVFINACIFSFFEGCNSVSLLQSVRFRVSVCQSIVALCGLYFGCRIIFTFYSFDSWIRIYIILFSKANCSVVDRVSRW